MAINFPDNPTVGQTFTAANRTWTYNGSSWVGDYSSTGNADTIDGIDSSQFLRSDTSDTMTGSLGITGNVGAGTTNPITRLHVAQAGRPFTSTADKTNGDMTGIVITSNTNQNTMSGIWFSSGTDHSGTHWSGISGSRSNYLVDWSTQLTFYTHVPSTTNITQATEKMRITGDGNVQVKGDNIGITQADGDYLAKLGQVGADGYLELFSGEATPVSRTKITSYGNSYINPNGGNVGIGTTNPTSTLDVSGTGAIKIPVGTTAQRPTAATGQLRFNSTAGSFEGYNGSAWGSIGGGATGGGGDQVFVENDQTVTANYTIPANKNALTTGPIEINAGVVVTISSGARWVII